MRLPKQTYKSEGCYGRYSSINERLNWFDCREEFFDEVFVFSKGKPKCFVYWHKDNEKPNIITLLNKVQDKLGLKKNQRLKIKDTNIKNIIGIKLSKFWRKKVAFDFLTILLRAGRKYQKGKIHKAHSYLRKTKIAVKRFLNGYTKYTDKFFDGWVDCFRNKRHIKNLIKP